MIPPNVFATGSEDPPFSGEKIRMYSMRFCPFAQRPLLVSIAKGIPLEIVNIHLKQKPEWFLKMYPDGTVPVLRLKDNRIIGDSAVVAQYLEDAFPDQVPLSPKDPYLKARDRMFLEKFSPIIMKVLMTYYEKEKRREFYQQFHEKCVVLEDELKRRGTSFFFGNDRPGLVDYLCWPIFQRALAHCAVFDDISMPPKDKYPLLNGWIERMQKDKAVVESVDQKQLVEFGKLYVDQVYNYDYGL